MSKSKARILVAVLCCHWGGGVLAQKPMTTSPVFVRGFAPNSGILRAGRKESLAAVIKFLRKPTDRLTARLIVPSDVKILSSRDVVLAEHRTGEIERVEWEISAQAPVQGYASIEVLNAESKQLDAKRISINFELPVKLPEADYIPSPKPQSSARLVLAHYCPLWKYGAHSMGWDTIQPWPERKPAIGFYDEGTPLVADWQIKYAVEHGIDGFIFTWDKIWLNPTIANSPGKGLTEGFLRARFLDKAKFCINWADQYYTSSRQELLDEIFPYWLEHFFKHPSYVRIDNRPVLFIDHPEQVATWLGGIEESAAVLDQLRSRCRQSGFDGLTIVGCVPTAESGRLKTIADAGYDATSAYIFWADLWKEAKKDIEGIPTFSHAAAMKVHGDLLSQRRKLGVLPDIVTVQMGWDSRPWHGVETPYYLEGASVENFERACRNAKRIVESNDRARIDGQIVVLDNWNEFGEGHFIEPTSGFGFGFLDAVKRVFADDSAPCSHIVPSDLKFTRPDRVFEQCRGILHKPYRRDRVSDNDLITSWSFDKRDERIVSDSSGSGLHAFKSAVDSVVGVKGRAFQSEPFGHAIVGADAFFYPRDGVTVEFWYKTDKRQDNAFFVNTAAEENTGYGVAMRNGKIAFYLNWTQMVETPGQAPLGKWTHVAATCDNREMVLYIDGKLKVTAPSGQLIRAAKKGTVCIGAYNPGAISFSGAIDELKIHRRALSSDQISHLAAISVNRQ